MNNFSEIWRKTNEIKGWFSEEEGRQYYDILSTLPGNATVIEVGVYHGRSTSIPAQMGRFTLYAVDIFGKDCYNGDGYYIEQFEVNVPNAMIIKGTSVEAMEFFKDESVDLVFIDADHFSPAIDQDCELWLPKVKHGGWMTFHDYQIGNYPDVVRCVDRYCAGWDGGVNNTFAFRRKP